MLAIRVDQRGTHAAVQADGLPAALAWQGWLRPRE